MTAVVNITKLKVKNQRTARLFLSAAENGRVGGETINTVRYGESGPEGRGNDNAGEGETRFPYFLSG